MSDRDIEPSGMWKYIHPLERSSIKMEVFRYLCEIYPKSTGLEEIAEAVFHYKADVIGVLIGYLLRYRKSDSLVGLGLVSCTISVVNDTPVRMFSVAPRGLEVRDYLKEQALRSMLSTKPGLFSRLRDQLRKK